MTSSEQESRTLQFEPIPEVTVAESIDLLRQLAHRSILAPSYGAYVIRNMILSDVGIFKTMLNGLWHGHAIKNQQFNKNKDQPLHQDDGRRNDLTIHQTQKGQAEVIIFVGAKQKIPHPTSISERDARLPATKELFMHGIYRGPAPDQALRTSLNPHDVLFFDHTQPHAFQSLTDDRLSRASYKV